MHTHIHSTGDLCGVAHSAADTGGEFTAQFQTDLSTFFEPQSWYVPTQDLLQIYAAVNYTQVTAQSIEECHLLFAAGSLAIKYAAELVYIPETGKAPFLQEKYLDYALGGVDDMAVWSARLWNRFAGVKCSSMIGVLLWVLIFSPCFRVD